MRLPDVITDDMYMAAVDVLDAFMTLEIAKAHEPDWQGPWPVNGYEIWTRWSEQEYEPAADRWRRAVDQLRALTPTGVYARDVRRTAGAVIAAWAACESCRQRVASTTVVIGGEPFRVCTSCVLPEQAVA